MVALFRPDGTYAGPVSQKVAMQHCYDHPGWYWTEIPDPERRAS